MSVLTLTGLALCTMHFLGLSGLLYRKLVENYRLYNLGFTHYLISVMMRSSNCLSGLDYAFVH
eukprot:164846-Pelagomonas_calceolata.AAC.1